jgi:hypothetical protein
MDFKILLAKTQEEKEAVYSFRYRVYVEEMSKYHLKADHERRMMYDEIDEWALVYYGLVNNEIVSTVRSIRGTENVLPVSEVRYFEIDKLESEIPHNKIAIVNRLAVDKKYRHTSITAHNFYSTYKDGSVLGIQLCFVTCEELLLPIYLHYGFRVYGEPIILDGNKKRYRLVLFVTDYSYLKSVNSPFLQFFDGLTDDKGEYAAKVKEILGYEFRTPQLSLKQKALGSIIKYRNKFNKLFEST